jgi:phosphoribosylpyrophosphate synthetase
MIDTGKTLILAAKTLAEKGAKAVYALVSHGKCPPRHWFRAAAIPFDLDR